MFIRKKSDTQLSPHNETALPPSNPQNSEVHGNQNILGMFSTNKRRIGERLAQTMGKESTHDGDFEQRRIEANQLYLKVIKLKNSMQATLVATRVISQKAIDLSNVCNELDVRDDEFIQAQLRLDEELRSSLEASVGVALDSLEKKIVGFKELEEKVKIRNDLKLDYDHYVRKVKELKEKPGMDSIKLSNNESKLELARKTLHEATLSVYKLFNYYSALGGKLIAPEIEMFKTAQFNYYRGCFECVDSMTLRDPEEVGADVERIGGDGSNRPIITGYEGTYADSTRAFLEKSPSYVAPAPLDSSSKKSMDSSGSGTATVPWGKAGGSSSKGAWWEQSSTAPPPPPTQGPPPRLDKAKAMYDYTAADGTEISFKVNDIIEIVRKDDSGWWVGKIGGFQGLFPANYVKTL